MKWFSNWSNNRSKSEVIRKSDGKGTQKDKEQPHSHQNRKDETLSCSIHPPGQEWFTQELQRWFKSLVNCAKFGYVSPNSLENVNQVNSTSSSLLETTKKGFIYLISKCSVIYNCCDGLWRIKWEQISVRNGMVSKLIFLVI